MEKGITNLTAKLGSMHHSPPSRGSIGVQLVIFFLQNTDRCCHPVPLEALTWPKVILECSTVHFQQAVLEESTCHTVSEAGTTHKPAELNWAASSHLPVEAVNVRSRWLVDY